MANVHTLNEASATQFLATRDGIPVGRILVSDDPHYNKHHDTNVGCFGMFECVDDPETAYALLDAGADWLHARGRSAVMGPVDYSTNYPTGLLIDGFDTPPRIMMNHHRPYYADLLESWGLTKAKDLYSWWFLDPKDLGNQWRGRLERLEQRGRITIRPMRLGEFDAETERGRIIYNGSMENNWGSVALTEAEFRYLAHGIKQLTLPQLVMVAEVRGEPVGFTVVVPDLNEAILPLDGRLMKYGLPINVARLKYRLKRVKTVRMIALGILEGYRRRGIAELLILRVLDYGKNHCGFTGAELGWTLEDNHQINRPIEAVGARNYKTYRVYEKSL